MKVFKHRADLNCWARFNKSTFVFSCSSLGGCGPVASVSMQFYISKSGFLHRPICRCAALMPSLIRFIFVFQTTSEEGFEFRCSDMIRCVHPPSLTPFTKRDKLHPVMKLLTVELHFYRVAEVLEISTIFSNIISGKDLCESYLCQSLYRADD